jgi:hypothetical protein
MCSKGEYLCNIMYDGLYVNVYLCNGQINLYLRGTNDLIKSYRPGSVVHQKIMGL